MNLYTLVPAVTVETGVFFYTIITMENFFPYCIKALPEEAHLRKDEEWSRRPRSVREQRLHLVPGDVNMRKESNDERIENSLQNLSGRK